MNIAVKTMRTCFMRRRCAQSEPRRTAYRSGRDLGDHGMRVTRHMNSFVIAGLLIVIVILALVTRITSLDTYGFSDDESSKVRAICVAMPARLASSSARSRCRAASRAAVSPAATIPLLSPPSV